MGASTAIFGLMGAYIAFIILNYTYLIENNRICEILIFFLLALFMSLMLSLTKVRQLNQSFDIDFFLECGLVGSPWWIPYRPCRWSLGYAVLRNSYCQERKGEEGWLDLRNSDWSMARCYANFLLHAANPS